jgi:hypothetical protein
VCEAREYAYDWNSGTDVPGNGRVLEQDAIALARRIIGTVRRPVNCHETTMTTSVADQMAVRRAGNNIPNGEVEQLQTSHDSSLEHDITLGPSLDGIVDTPVTRQASVSSSRNDHPPPVRRRHGGAMPM